MIEISNSINLAERFQHYRALKSFRTSVWSKYEAISPDLHKIHVLENPNVIKANSVAHHFQSVVGFPGMYCRMRLHLGANPDALKQYFAGLKPGTPIIVSSLLKWERQVTQCHVRLRLHNENTMPVESRRVYEVHAGFRRFRANMLFSKIYSHCDKAKFTQTVESYEDHIN